MIETIYRFIWRDVLQRREPWTPQLKRMLKAHPLAWLLTILAGFTGAAGFVLWLIFHLAEWGL